MPAFYFDSSAVVKLYVAERGSRWVRRTTARRSGNTIYTVHVTGAEVIAAFFLRMRAESLTTTDAERAATRFRSDLRRRYDSVAVGWPLINAAMLLAQRHGLRGYDAIQLAAALAVQPPEPADHMARITFVSADHRLSSAATAEGFVVEDPNQYQ